MIGTLYIHTDEYYYEIVKKVFNSTRTCWYGGISRQYVTDIENSSRCKHITIAILGRIADTLDVNIELFFRK